MATKPPRTLRAMIATARKAKPWSLPQLGDALGTVRPGGKAVSQQFLNDLEHARCKPGEALLHALAKILHLDLAVLQCATGEGLPFVNAYLQTHPQTRPEMARLLRHSKENQFSD